MTPFSTTITTTGGGSYKVLLGTGVSGRLGGIVESTGASRVVVITDSNLERLHARDVVRLAASTGRQVDLLSFPAGEEGKTRETKARLEDRLVELGCGRDTVVVALGGGVAGDMAGFVAATFMRGLPWIQVPTSLLAMADASLGGKTGVDHPLGKNLIGAFHHPRAVLADLDFLKTLPSTEFLCGLAEMVKAAMVGDRELFELLEARAPGLAAGETTELLEPLSRAVAVKAAVVCHDDLESGLRKVLNFGHTLGHALERACGYALPHGLAVAAGMAAEARLAVRLGLLAEVDCLRLAGLLEALGLPSSLPQAHSPAQVLEAASTDKKSRGGGLEFALPSGMGRMAGESSGWTIPVAGEVVLEHLEELRRGPHGK